MKPHSSSPASPVDQGGAPERILRAALDLFKERGYHGTPVRTIARVVGIKAASLYYHFPSKQHILFSLFDRTMDDLLAGLARATAQASGARDRLRAVVRFHVLYHIDHQDEAFLSHSELRSLSAANRNAITAKRDRYERGLRELIEEGVAAGAFRVADVRLTTIAVLMMCSGVSDWFSAGGRLTGEGVADSYAEMVFRLVGAAGTAAESQRPDTHGSGARDDGSPAAPHGSSRWDVLARPHGRPPAAGKHDASVDPGRSPWTFYDRKATP